MPFLENVVVVTSLLLASGCASTSMPSQGSQVSWFITPPVVDSSPVDIATPRRHHEVESHRRFSNPSSSGGSTNAFREKEATRRCF